MKKTIIAASIAAVVAAPAAFADVKISGQNNIEFYSSNTATGSNQAADELGVDRNTDIVISVSEDLDNGMKAFATISIVDDASSNDAVANNSAGASSTAVSKDDGGMSSGSTQIVGLATDFGTITMGKQELFIESKAAAMAANDAADYLSNEVSTSAGETAEASVEYTSPSMGGFQVVLSARGITTSASTDNDDLDTTGVGVQYSNAGLLVRAATVDKNGTDTDVMGVQYSMGDLKMGVVSAQEGTAKRQTWYGASYKMGNNEIALSTTKSDTASAEDTILSLKHSMSKNVAVYFAYEDDSTSATASTDTALLGMQVKF
jgi:hypothetical protein